MPYLMDKHNVHESLIGGSIILKAKEHEFVVVVSIIRHKVVLGASMGFILTWLYLEYAFMNINV